MHIKNLLERKAQSNVSIITLQLLKKLKVPVTASTVVDSLEQHPDYPSLYSISDSLQKWKVENLAFKVDTEKLEEIPTPFIAHSKTGGGNFILVNSVNGVVDFIDEKGKQKKKTKEEFNKEWDQIVLVAEKNEHSGEKNFEANRKTEQVESVRIPIIIAATLLMIVLFSIITAHIIATTLLLLKFAGVVTTGLLLWFEIDKNNPVVQQICSAGNKTNCTAVLSSKQSKLLGWIGWSEVGFFYFTGSFLFLQLTANYQWQSISVLSWLNLFALPYTIFSVFYQWRVAKQWCPLCLTVQAILILEFVACYFGFWQSSAILSLSKDELVPLLCSFSLPVFFWVATKKIYLNAQNGSLYKKEFSKLKYNGEIFNALLSKEKQITVSSEGLGIELGNPSAKNKIIKVCNPLCGPCSKAHVALEELLINNSNVQIQIIFSVHDNPYNKPAIIAKHLLAIYSNYDGEVVKQALDDWYLSKEKEYEEFALKYPVNDLLEMQKDMMKQMHEWCAKMEVRSTPTVFVNGFQLPEIYAVSDLKYLLSV